MGQLCATETGHVDIGNDEGDITGTGDKHDNRLHPVGAAHDVIAEFLEDGGDVVADGGIVVHQEDQLAVAVGYVYVKRRGAGCLGRLAFHGGQKHAESGAATNLRVQFDKAVVVYDYATNRGEPQARSLAYALGGEERPPDALQHVGGNASARVGKPEHEPGALAAPGNRAGRRRIELAVGRGDGHRAAFWHGVAGVHAKIEENLVNLRGVSQYRPEVGGNGLLKLNGLGEGSLNDIDDVAHDVLHLCGLEFAGCATRKSEDLPHQSHAARRAFLQRVEDLEVARS